MKKDDVLGPLTKAELIAWGSGAYLNSDLTDAFPIGNLHNFAEKELPNVM